MPNILGDMPLLQWLMNSKCANNIYCVCGVVLSYAISDRLTDLCASLLMVIPHLTDSYSIACSVLRCCSLGRLHSSRDHCGIR